MLEVVLVAAREVLNRRSAHVLEGSRLCHAPALEDHDAMREGHRLDGVVRHEDADPRDRAERFGYCPPSGPRYWPAQKECRPRIFGGVGVGIFSR